MTVRRLDYSILRLEAERFSLPLDRFPMPTANQRDEVAPTATDPDSNASAHLSNTIDAPSPVLRCAVPFVVGTVVSSTLSTPIRRSFLHLLDPNSSAPRLSRSTAPSATFHFLRSSTSRRRNGASLFNVHPPPLTTFLGPNVWNGKGRSKTRNLLMWYFSLSFPFGSPRTGWDVVVNRRAGKTFANAWVLGSVLLSRLCFFCPSTTCCDVCARWHEN